MKEIDPNFKQEEEKECTKPNCNCMAIAEEKEGGGVKNYPCLQKVKMRDDLFDDWMQKSIDLCKQTSSEEVLNALKKAAEQNKIIDEARKIDYDSLDKRTGSK